MLQIGERRRLGEAILTYPNLSEPGYLTQSEQEGARRDAEDFIETAHSGFSVGLADQPYNIRFGQPEFLEPLGIQPSRQPESVEVEV